MVIMPANHRGQVLGYLQGKYGCLGHLYSTKDNPKWFLPYVLDNGVFAKGEAWDEDEYFDFLDYFAKKEQQPTWVLVPDAVGDKKKTLERWKKYSERIKEYGFSLAFACQDGMGKEDVPQDAEVIFIGGSTEWKWESLPYWTMHFKRVHVGRVNSISDLQRCYLHEVESVDGTGYGRGGDITWKKLEYFLEWQKERGCVSDYSSEQLYSLIMQLSGSDNGSQLLMPLHSLD